MKPKEENIDFALITRHLSDETTDAEQKRLNDWLESSVENRKRLDEKPRGIVPEVRGVEKDESEPEKQPPSAAPVSRRDEPHE